MSPGQYVRDHFTDLILATPTVYVPLNTAQASAYLRASHSQRCFVSIHLALIGLDYKLCVVLPVLI